MDYNQILTNSPSTNFAPENAERIPAELKELQQWVCWKGVERNGKLSKQPINPKNGRNASVKNPRTWTDFESALTASGDTDGLGFVFTEADPFIGVDLDHVLDPETGELDSEANEIISLLDSYTEISQSGKGIHIIARGTKLPGRGRRKGKIEIYDQRRYFCMTGNLFAHGLCEIRERGNQLDELYQTIFSAQDDVILLRDGPSTTEKKDPPKHFSKPHPGDVGLLRKAARAGNGEKFSSLYYRGEWKGQYPSRSEADQALCAILAFWCRADGARIDGLFRRSQLFRPKWDEQRGELTYGQKTVRKAVADHVRFLQKIAADGTDPIRAFAIELMQAIELCPWKSRSGATDLQVLKAHLAIVLESRQLIHHADVRTIADKAGIKSINTASCSHTRLKERGWLEIVSAHKKGTTKANTYNLIIPTHLKHTIKTIPTPPPPHSCVLECPTDERSLDLWISNKGLGKTRQKIWQQLDETEGQTVNYIARRNWVRPATMRKHLHKLSHFELAHYDSGLWYRGDKEPAEIAAQLGISGTLELQKAFHQEQREARNHLLSSWWKPHDSAKLIVKTDPGIAANDTCSTYNDIY